MDMLVALEEAGASGHESASDTDLVVSALGRLGARVVDPVAQKTLLKTTSSSATTKSPPHRGRMSFSPSSAAGVGSGAGGFRKLFRLLRNNLSHPNSRVAAAALSVITDALSHINWELPGAGGEPEELHTVALVLPAVVHTLKREELRRAARLLFTAVQAKHGVDLITSALVRTGMESEDNTLRAEATRSIIALIQRCDVPRMNVKHTVNNLAARLRDEDPDVVVAAEQALGHMYRIDPSFGRTVKKLDYAHQQYINSHLPTIKRFAASDVSESRRSSTDLRGSPVRTDPNPSPMSFHARKPTAITISTDSADDEEDHDDVDGLTDHRSPTATRRLRLRKSTSEDDGDNYSDDYEDEDGEEEPRAADDDAGGNGAGVGVGSGGGGVGVGVGVGVRTSADSSDSDVADSMSPPRRKVASSSPSMWRPGSNSNNHNHNGHRRGLAVVSSTTMASSPGHDDADDDDDDDGDYNEDMFRRPRKSPSKRTAIANSAPTSPANSPPLYTGSTAPISATPTATRRKKKGSVSGPVPARRHNPVVHSDDDGDSTDDSSVDMGCEMVLGVIPASLVRQLTDESGRWQAKASAVEDLLRVLSDVDDTSALLPHMEPLLRMVASLLKDTQFKIVMSMLKVVEVLIDKVGHKLVPPLHVLLPALFEKLGDNKIVVRQANLRCFGLLMQRCKCPQLALLPWILRAFQHRNRHIREEALKLFMMGVLHEALPAIDTSAVVTACTALLTDSSVRIRLGTVEALALLQNNVVSDFDVVRDLQEAGASSEQVEAVMLRLHATDDPSPAINDLGLLELPYETAGGSLSYPSTDLDSVRASRAGSASGSGSMSLSRARVGSGSDSRMSAGRQSRPKIPFDIPRSTRTRVPSASSRGGMVTPTGSAPTTFNFSPRSPTSTSEPRGVTGTRTPQPHRTRDLSFDDPMANRRSTYGDPGDLALPPSITDAPAFRNDLALHIPNGENASYDGPGHSKLFTSSGAAPLTVSDRPAPTPLTVESFNNSPSPFLSPQVPQSGGAPHSHHRSSGQPSSSPPALAFPTSGGSGSRNGSAGPDSGRSTDAAFPSRSLTSPIGLPSAGLTARSAVGKVPLWLGSPDPASFDSAGSAGGGGGARPASGSLSGRSGVDGKGSAGGVGIRAYNGTNQQRHVVKGRRAAPSAAVHTAASPQSVTSQASSGGGSGGSGGSGYGAHTVGSPPLHRGGRRGTVPAGPDVLSARSTDDYSAPMVAPARTPPSPVQGVGATLSDRGYVVGSSRRLASGEGGGGGGGGGGGAPPADTQSEQFSRGRRRRGQSRQRPGVRDLDAAAAGPPDMLLVGKRTGSSGGAGEGLGRMSSRRSSTGSNVSGGGGGVGNNVALSTSDPSGAVGRLLTDEPPTFDRDPRSMHVLGRAHAAMQPVRTSSALVTKTELMSRLPDDGSDDEDGGGAGGGGGGAGGLVGTSPPDGGMGVMAADGVASRKQTAMKSQLASLKQRKRGRRVLSASSRAPSGARPTQQLPAPLELELSRRETSGRWTVSEADDEGDPSGRDPTPPPETPIDPSDRPIRPMGNMGAYFSEEGGAGSPFLESAASPTASPTASPAKPRRMTRATMARRAMKQRKASIDAGTGEPNTPSVSPRPSSPPSASAGHSRSPIVSPSNRRVSKSPRPRRVHNKFRSAEDGSASMRSGRGSVASSVASNGLSATEGGPGRSTRRRRDSIETLAKKGGDALYTDSADLPVLPHPEKALRDASKSLGSSNWAEQFAALDTVRAIARHQPHVLSANHSDFHALILQLTETAKSLRSTVSRNAITTMADMFTGLGKGMDTELDTLLGILLMKAADVSGFLCIEADKALLAMVDHTSGTRVIPALFALVGHKSAPMRAKVAVWLDRTVAALGPRVASIRDKDRLIKVAVKFLEGSKEEARRAAKRMVVRLHRAKALDTRVVERSFDRRVAGIVSDVIAKGLPDSELACPPPASTRGGDGSTVVSSPLRDTRRLGPASTRSRSSVDSPARFFPRRKGSGAGAGAGAGAGGDDGASVASGRSSISGKPKPRRRGTRQVGGRHPPSPLTSAFTDELKPVVDKLNSSDWRSRQSALATMVEVCEANTDAAGSNVMMVTDEIAKRLQDGNIKVQNSALKVCKRVLSVLGSSVEGGIPRLVPALTNLLASNRSNVATSSAVLDVLAASVAHPQGLLVAYSSVVQHHSNTKVRGAVLDKVAGLVPSVHETKPALLTQIVLPTAFATLGQAKADLRSATESTVLAVAKILGNDAVRTAGQHLKDHEQTLLHGILTSRGRR